MSTAREQNPTQRDEEIDLNALLGTLIDHKWLIIVVTTVFFVLSVAYAVLAAPVYEANAMVQVEQKVPDLPGLSAITQTLGASDSEDLTEIAIITSRSVVGRAVDNLNLNVVVKPHRFPIFGGFIARHYVPENPGDVADPWLGLNSYGWGGEALDVFQLDVSDQEYSKSLTLIAGEKGAYVLLNEHGKVLLHGQVGEAATGHGVTMQVKTLIANPGMQFEVVRNRELTTINALQLMINATEEGKDSGIIGMTYQNTDPELARQVLNQVTQAYVRQNVDRNSAQAASSLQFVQQQLPITRESLDKAQDALNAFQVKSHSVNISLQTKALLDQGVAIESSIQQLQLQQADMERRFTKDHPAYKALLQQIGQLESEKADMDKKVGDLPDTQRDLLRLTEDVQVNNNTYTGLLNQAQQLEIAKAGTVGNVRIVDTSAVDISLPVKPKKAIVIIGGTFLGGLFAVGFVFIRQMLNRGVEDPSEIEQLGLPVYASIPLSQTERDITLRTKQRRGDGNQHLLAISAPADLATEALRSLRTSLHFAQLEAKNNLLMISGSSPSAGKTFVSSNLAAVVAQSGQRVLLIDADMRKGALHRTIGGHAENGLSELITGQIDQATAIRTVPLVEGLHFIARGKVPPNPSELLMHRRFTELLQELMVGYDLVIVDTPPVLAVTDAAVIGRHAGTTLLVVRFGLNQSREIALAKQRFDQNGVNIKGVVFNAVEKRNAGYYSYGYYEYQSAS